MARAGDLETDSHARTENVRAQLPGTSVASES